jgi:uncharacterized protein with PQ loop repeat
MMIDLVGWLASGVLLLTLIRQIVKQSRSEGEGVSTWLFIGQATASGLFVVYSILLKNWVFIVTNSALLLTALIGQWLTHRRCKSDRSRQTPADGR